MGLNRSQYDALMREYDKRRLTHKRELDDRTLEIYNKIPRIKEINDSISTISVQSAKRMLLQGLDNTADKKEFRGNTMPAVVKQIEALSREKTAILRENGFPDDYLSMRYTCPDCKDTGYIDSHKCHCLRNSIIEILYEQSNIKEVLERENFSTFSFKYFDDTVKDSITGVTALKNMHGVVKTCRDFIQNFDSEYKSLFFYGATGVGKTFLTNCIAKELIDKSYSVIYVSSIRLFEILADNTFNRTYNDGASELAGNLFDCDLLIIDDLGTELINTFTASSFFNCINERHIRRKPVIISTNLSLAELRANYSERVFSRITSNYTLLKIYGDDLRMKLR